MTNKEAADYTGLTERQVRFRRKKARDGELTCPGDMDNYYTKEPD
jgi:hypothetical protein